MILWLTISFLAWFCRIVISFYILQGLTCFHMNFMNSLAVSWTQYGWTPGFSDAIHCSYITKYIVLLLLWMWSLKRIIQQYTIFYWHIIFSYMFRRPSTFIFRVYFATPLPTGLEPSLHQSSQSIYYLEGKIIIPTPAEVWAELTRLIVYLLPVSSVSDMHVVNGLTNILNATPPACN